MIAHLRGALIAREADQVVVEAGGVGYAVTVTAATLKELPLIGAETRLHIYAHAAQDSPLQLYGFHEAGERRVFETLLGVQGVGPRVAVAIVSAMPVGDLARAIAGGDLARLTQIRGVGRKIAERLVVELRQKIQAVAGGATAGSDRAGAGVGAGAGAAPAGRLGEVWAALVALGYRPAELEPIVSKLDPAIAPADLVKQALSALRRK
jgi:Holliday junction DNA helicase RuvA